MQGEKMHNLPKTFSADKNFVIIKRPGKRFANLINLMMFLFLLCFVFEGAN